jgi:hypothetical protein
MVMRRNTTEQQRTSPRSSSSGNPFWSTFSGQQQHRHGVLRIELSSGRTWLLPYGHWELAFPEKLEGMQQLTIQFTSHEVRIEGEHLQEILLELQAGNVEVLREGTDRFQTLTGAVVIQAIVITELRPVALG